MHIYDDARTVSRADLAAWLRQLASQLESGARIFYGAAGAVAVADQVRCELEIERESDTEISVEIEFSWTSPEAPGSVVPPAGVETTKSDEGVDEEAEEIGDAEEAGKAAVPEDGSGDAGAGKSASVAEGTSGSA